MTQNKPIRVGIIGTGFAAKLRADTFYTDDRTHLVAVAGNNLDRTQTFARSYNAEVVADWQELVQRQDIDLVAICTINSLHGAIARLALQHGKHAIVEYPLSLDPVEAEELLTLAATNRLLLHVEHIELLGGLHQALIQSLPAIEPVSYVRYVTIAPKHPAPRRWTYNSELFGFPLVGALSRLHRLTDRFGEVATASAQARFWDAPESAPESGFHRACLCTAQLQFTSGVLGEVVYGKGETFWQAQNRMEVHGDRGTLILEPDRGELIRDGVVQPLTIGSRRGLFTQDTKMAIDFLVDGTPLYVENTQSVYTLKVADRLRRSC